MLSRIATRRSLSRWSHVKMGPKDPILGVSERFHADSSPAKLNLGVGAYRDDDGKPVVLPSVQEAQRVVLERTVHNEYAPIGGEREFVDNALDLAFSGGEARKAVGEGRVAALQSLSGTGSLRLIGGFLERFVGAGTPVYVPNPTWGNHIPIFADAGLDVRKYRYYSPETKGLDLGGMIEDIKGAPDGSAILLHACAHNPTGVDPSAEQWAEISAAVKERGHFVIFDSAYQGFASGDPTKDGAAVQLFVEDGHQVALSQSFAKNFGLYGHRVGCLSVVTESADEAKRVESQLKIIARAMYSSPPIQGARVVNAIWEDPKLREQWYGDVKGMAERIIGMRTSLAEKLGAAGSQHDWTHITDQIGMFCFSGMTPEQVETLITKHHVYLTSNGRISMAGVTSKNVEYLANAIHDVTK